MNSLDAHRCVFCADFCADGDRIACVEHRRQMDATPMPWDAKPATATPDAGHEEE